MSEYLSVSKFAKAADISKSAAYSLLEEEEYKQYLTIDNGVKRVSSELLEVLRQKENETTVAASNSPAPPARKNEVKRTEEPEAKVESKPIEEPPNTESTAAAEEIERLRQEVEDLKQTVKAKDEAISDKDKQIAEFALKFAELAQQAQIIAGQAQLLQAADKPKAIEAQRTQTPAAEDITEQQPQQRTSFWRRIFGK